MATIYLARHALLKRPTAIKILKKHVATDEFVHRFEREVQVASQLLHPNTVRDLRFRAHARGRAVLRDGVPGRRDARRAGRRTPGPVPPGRVIHILRQVGAALREAHEHGMIHRDVKPENVMLCRRGEDDVVKLLDFGLVKDLERAQTRDITKQLKILGTPRYMAPERILNPGDVDARSDIYALGAVGYFLLAGKPIFDGDEQPRHFEPGAAHACAARIRERCRRHPGGARRADRRLPGEGPGAAAADDRCRGRGARSPLDSRSRGRRPTPRRGGRSIATGAMPPRRRRSARCRQIPSLPRRRRPALLSRMPERSNTGEWPVRRARGRRRLRPLRSALALILVVRILKLLGPCDHVAQGPDDARFGIRLVPLEASRRIAHRDEDVLFPAVQP